MMRRRVDLPMASGGKSPTPPRRQLNMPEPNTANVFSFVWVIFGLALFAAGYLHCNSHREYSRLYCAEDVCTLTRELSGSASTVEEHQFLRESLVSAKQAYLDSKGRVTEDKRNNRRSTRRTTQTYSISWKDAETQATTTLPMTQFGLARKVPRERVALIMQYVKKQVDDLDVSEGRWLTGIGIVCFVFGFLLLFIRVAIGPLFLEAPSRRDLSRRKLFK